MKIKNNTIGVKTWCGQLLNSEEVYQIQPIELKNWAIDQSVLTDIENESAIILTDLDEPLTINTAIATLTNTFSSSVAVDLNNDDQSINTDEWVEIEASRVIWDLNEDYSLETNNFLVPFDGIYFFDGEWRITNLVNVTAVEVAMFKRLENGDDYWFILDKKLIAIGQTEAQLSAATSFDFYEGDEYTVKIKLYGTSPSAVIEGEDDYTAWGYSFSKPVY